MTVESNYVIAIATLFDWLKDSRQFFNQWELKPEPSEFERVTDNYYELRLVHRRLRLLWLVGVIALVLVFRQSFENRSILERTDGLP